MFVLKWNNEEECLLHSVMQFDSQPCKSICRDYKSQTIIALDIIDMYRDKLNHLKTKIMNMLVSNE